MAIVTFNINDFGFKDREELKEVINRIGLEVEEVKGDDILIDVTPNRPDLLDFYGLKRAIDNFSGKKALVEDYYSVKNGAQIEIEVGSGVGKIRPYIAAFVAKGVKLNERKLKYMINFTDKLADTYGRNRKKMAIGLHNYNVINGNLVYDASSEGKFLPIGAEVEMDFDEIIEKHAKGIRYSNTIEGKGKRVYPFLKDSEKILSMIPIINSKATAINEKTSNILVDVTGTSKKTVNDTANLLAASLMDQGGEIFPIMISYGKKSETTPTMGYREIKTSLNKIDATIGAKLTESMLVGYANKMGYPASKYGNYILVKVPPYRLDVLNYQDVVEDIAISFGYDRVVPVPVRGVSVGLPGDLYEYGDEVARYMIGLGFTEAINNYLTNDETEFSNTMRVKSDDIVTIAYSKTESITMLRSTELPGLLQDLGRSVHEKMPQRMFEVGSVFDVRDGKVHERVNLAFVSQDSKVNFAEVKSAVASIMAYLGLKYEIGDDDDPAFIPGRCAKILIDGKKRGVFGEINPAVLENFKLMEPVVACEINLVGEVSYFSD